MLKYNKNFIPDCSDIIEAMRRLHDIPETLTLFVLDERNGLLGTLTDGDIRRGFIKGLSLTDKVTSFMTTNYHAIQNGFSVREFKMLRELGVRLLPILDKENKITKIYDLKTTKSLLPLECVIMAGGRGERLRPLTDNTPKPMLLLADKPIIEHNIDRLINFGIEKIYISIKYLGQQIVDHFGDGSSKGIDIEYIWEDEPLGTAGALSLVKDFKTEHILLMNSDLFTNVDFEDLYLKTILHNASIGVATVPYTTKVPYGIFQVKGNQIIELREKPVYTNHANAGIYIINTETLDQIPYKTFYNITDLIKVLIENNQLVIHNQIVGYWVDIGQHQEYQNALEIASHLE